MRALLASVTITALAGCNSATTSSVVAEPTVVPITTSAKTATRPPVDQIAEDYIGLTLIMDTFEKGYVDAYYGPEKYKEFAAKSDMSLVEVGNQLVRLMERLDDNRPAAFEAVKLSRHRFLSAQLEAAVTRHAMISGEVLPFVREAKGLFGVKPEIKPLESFDPILEEIQKLVPGPGPLSARVDRFENKYVIPKDKLKVVFDTAIAECKRRTEEYFTLPDTENFKMEFVTGKSWSGYNYYQGNYQSLIQINTDLPIKISRAVDLGCHEGYPGHHVYNMLLEKNLTRSKGWQEFSIYLLYSPQSLIAEGSANYGIELAFPGVKRLEYEREVLYPLAGLDPDTAGAFWALQIAKRALAGARITIAQGYLDKEIPREDAVAYTMKYQLVSRERAEQMLDFNDQYRSYVINYSLGQDMVREWIEAQGEAPVWRWKAMERLLSEPLLPGDLMG